MKYWQFSLALLGSIAEADFDPDTYIGREDPGQYRNFYIATEDCQLSSAPCILNFKYCFDFDTPYGPGCRGGWPRDNMSWAQLGQDDTIDWAVLPFFQDTKQAVPVLPFYYSPFSTFTLKWTNTKPKYPTTVVLSPNSGTSPLYRYKVVPAGQTEYKFKLGDLEKDMKLASDRDDVESCSIDFESVVSSDQFVFSIGQPEDPNRDKFDNLDKFASNYTDTSDPFFFSNVIVANMVKSQRDARNFADIQADAYREMQWRWKVGVAVGVGAGVPILIAIAFCLGMGAGERRSRRKVKTGEWDWTPDVVKPGAGESDVVVTEGVGNGAGAGGPDTRSGAVNNDARAVTTGEGTTGDGDISQAEAVQKNKAIDKGRGVDSDEAQLPADGHTSTIGQAE